MNNKAFVALTLICSASLFVARPSCAAVDATSSALSAQSPATTTGTAASISPAPVPGKWQNFWIDRVKGFIAENATLDPKTRNIVFLGDSLTQGFKLNVFFPGLAVLNRGIVSDGVCDFPDGRNLYRGVTRRLKECVYDCNPSHLFLLIGTNDVGAAGVPLDYWFGAYKYVVQQTRLKFPDVKIIVVTCPPCGAPYARRDTLNPRIVEWNAIIRDYAAKEGFRLIDLHALLVAKDGQLPPELTSDGLHFNKTGYARWAEAVHAILKQDGITADNRSETKAD